MTTLRTFKRRRATMAAFLRSLKRSQFDMRVVVAETRGCKTKACAMGWMPRAFPSISCYKPDLSEGSSWPHLRGESLSPVTAAKFFALPAAEFFYPESGLKTETPKQVAAQLLAAPYSAKYLGREKFT